MVEASAEPQEADELTCEMCVESDEIQMDSDNIAALKSEALSIEHLLTHLPKNPYCEARMEAKLEKSPSKRKKEMWSLECHGSMDGAGVCSMF